MALGNTEPTGPDGQGAPILAWTGATWTIATNKAINTPVAGTDVIVNGGFGADTDWTKENGWSISGGVATRATGTGTLLYQTITPLTVGKWYLIQWTISSYTSGVFSVYTGSYSANRSSANTFVEAKRAISTTFGIGKIVEGVASIDNVSAKELVLSELFASLQDVGTPNVIIDATLAAYTAGTAIGIVARLDSATAPANFIIAYQTHSGDGVVRIDECVAGVYTNLASVGPAFAASDVLRLDLSGANYRLYKVTSAGGATLLSASTTNVTAQGLSGLFSTYSANTFSRFTVMAKAGYSIPE